MKLSMALLIHWALDEMSSAALSLVPVLAVDVTPLTPGKISYGGFASFVIEMFNLRETRLANCISLV